MHASASHVGLLAILGLVVVACQAPAAASSGPTRVVVGVTETLESQNPYADSVALGYAIWCEVLGCLTPRDPFTGKHPIGLAESWTVEDPNTWIFHLRRNARWHDGSPFTAADIVHSIWRINNDKESKQKVQVSRVAEAEALDEY